MQLFSDINRISVRKVCYCDNSLALLVPPYFTGSVLIVSPFYPSFFFLVDLTPHYFCFFMKLWYLIIWSLEAKAF
ncbi:uncharacterized protein DS421_7g218150 [Arachis hypogaea]|nr:uncharacterized protein DS421_7g218150 [Arachis hypogaea]